MSISAPTRASTVGTTLRFARYDLLRLTRDWSTLFFSIALPVAMFLIFGAFQEYGSERINDSNVTAFVMVALALYAGMTGTVGAAGTIAVENQTGWGRQLALTPLTAGQLLSANLLGVAIRAVLPIVAVYVAGSFTGAEMPTSVWVSTLVLCVLMAVPFGLYGMAWALVVPTPGSVSIAATSTVVLAFLGGMFMPLSDTLLTIGRFTPVYGSVTVARYPMTDGIQITMDGQLPDPDPLWWALLNVGVWTAVFAAAVLLLRRRRR